MSHPKILTSSTVNGKVTRLQFIKDIIHMFEIKQFQNSYKGQGLKKTVKKGK